MWLTLQLFLYEGKVSADAMVFCSRSPTDDSPLVRPARSGPERTNGVTPACQAHEHREDRKHEGEREPVHLAVGEVGSRGTYHGGEYHHGAVARETRYEDQDHSDGLHAPRDRR